MLVLGSMCEAASQTETVFSFSKAPFALASHADQACFWLPETGEEGSLCQPIPTTRKEFHKDASLRMGLWDCLLKDGEFKVSIRYSLLIGHTETHHLGNLPTSSFSLDFSLDLSASPLCPHCSRPRVLLESHFGSHFVLEFLCASSVLLEALFRNSRKI